VSLISSFGESPAIVPTIKVMASGDSNSVPTIDGIQHPGVGVGLGAYDGPNTGNLWFKEGEDIEGYAPGAVKDKGLVPKQKDYEYLDHTADVQIHCWGKNLQETFEQAAVAMYGYMTEDIDTVEMVDSHTIEATGEDLPSLLFHFLDELLFIFAAQPFFIARRVDISEMVTEDETFSIKATAYGEQFNLAKHPAGTEIKAITYSAMQIYQKNNGDPTTKDDVEIYVIVDI